MQAPNEDLLRYYLEELSYLRRGGEGFARTYPKVAARLELQSDECPDPHVERLIESFAFLTARIQSGLDSDFPEIAGALLDVLYPHYLQPVPSLAVARFVCDPARGKLSTGYEIPRHTPLFAHSEQGAICRLRTCYPVTLWPIEVTAAELVSPDRYDFLSGSADAAAVLRLRLESLSDPFEVLGVDRLRFHLHGDPVLVNRLYELLFDGVRRIVAVPAPADSASAAGAATPATLTKAPVPRWLPSGALTAVGFGEDEQLLPAPRHAHPAYLLLQEHFAFPEKFHFADVSGLAGCLTGSAADLLFLLDRVPRQRLPVGAESFALGCTPVANLFRRTSEPLRIDHRRLEVPLVADLRRERSTEIHSILGVTGTSPNAARAGGRDGGSAGRSDGGSNGGRDGGVREYAPFYSFSHDMERRGQRAFYHVRRVPSPRPDLGGTELLISFRDLDFRPAVPPDETLFAQLLCTNRGLAAELPAGAVLQSDEALPVGAIVCLKKPTRPLDPPLGGQGLWRLVSHLSLNHLSLAAGEASLKALREILGLYCFSPAPALRRQIEGIREVSWRKVVRRLGGAGWQGFCRGTEVTVGFDESSYVGSSSLLLAAVLSRFFGLYSSTNSFTQLVTRPVGRAEESKRWPPMAGGKAVV
jgi:type VI secretion system protein ImpG